MKEYRSSFDKNVSSSLTFSVPISFASWERRFSSKCPKLGRVPPAVSMVTGLPSWCFGVASL